MAEKDAKIFKDVKILIECEKKCGNYKFATDEFWDKVVDPTTLSFFDKKVEKGEYILYHTVCPDCMEKNVHILCSKFKEAFEEN